MKKADFKTSHYFSWMFVLVGVAFIFIGSMALFLNPIVGVILLLVSILFLTTNYRLQIDFEKKEYFDYLWILGFKNGEKKKFDALDYLFTKKSNASQTMHYKSISANYQKVIYDGFLKFKNDDKIHIGTFDSKEKLMSRLHSISEKINVEIRDYTEKEYQTT